MKGSNNKNLTNSVKKEIPQLLRLAGPIALSQMGMMTMGIVDILMVGRLGPEFIGGVSVGNSVYFIFAIFGLGLLVGLDYLIPFAFGQKKMDQCHYWLIQGLYFTLMAALPLTLVIYGVSFLLPVANIDPLVEPIAAKYMRITCFSLWPFMAFFAFRNYLQAMNSVKFVSGIIIAANLANVLFNWVFVFGHWGMPEMKAEGTALATLLTRILMLWGVFVYTIQRDKKLNLGLLGSSFQVSKDGIKRIFSLGLPAALQMLFEAGVFSISTVIAGSLGAIQLAAHSLVLNIASFTFMVPLGISAASSVRVGQHLGEGSPQNARTVGWTSIGIAAGFMSFSALVLLLFGQEILSWFTDASDVITLGAQVILFAAVFQVADGVQVVGTGSLRGLGDTKSPLYANLLGFWVIGFPLGIYLTFRHVFPEGKEIFGLWSGLTAGLIFVAIWVSLKWNTQSQQTILTASATKPAEAT